MKEDEETDETDIIDGEVNDDIVEDEAVIDEEIDNDKTFVNPSQAGKFTSSQMFKCDKLDFVSTLKAIIDSHKGLIHNRCSICFSNFDNQINLKNHITNTHIAYQFSSQYLVRGRGVWRIWPPKIDIYLFTLKLI